MKPVVRICAGLAITWSVVTATAYAAPPSAAVCAACHSEDGSPRFGPTFQGVYGRKAGSANGFTYSPAMKKAELTWDEKSLDAFIANPQKTVPGTIMPFGGIADEKQRAEIIDYLKSVK